MGVLPIAEEFAVPVVMVAERGCGEATQRPIKSSITTGTAMAHSPSSGSSNYTPPHWPKHIRYLAAQQYHSSVNIDILKIIRGKQTPESHQRLGSKPSFVIIRKITGPSNHPASVFFVCQSEEACQTQAIVCTIQIGCGTVWSVCGEEDPATNASVGLSRGSSLRR